MTVILNMALKTNAGMGGQESQKKTDFQLRCKNQDSNFQKLSKDKNGLCGSRVIHHLM